MPNNENSINNAPEIISESWMTLNCENLNDDFDLIIQQITAIKLNNPSDVLMIKIITNVANDFCSINLKKFQQKFKNKSIVIFVAEKCDKKFLIYWKSKDIRQVLSLGAYKDEFMEEDKDVCEFAADFLVMSLRSGYLGIHIDHDVITIKGKIMLHHLIDSRNYNLLLLAAESGNVKPIKKLLQYSIESQLLDNDITAQSLAWENRHFDVLLELLQSNLPFPQQIEVSECSEELKSFIESSEEFHKMIHTQNIDKLDKIIQKYPNLKYFYNLLNESALKVALELDSTDIYEFLLSKHFSFAQHEDIDRIFNNLTPEKQQKILSIHQKYSIELPENHMTILMSNTSIIQDESDSTSYLTLIHTIYNQLNTDPRLKIILKAVTATKIFKIVFNFCLDASATLESSYTSHRIEIPSKNLLNISTRHKTYGALAHELCHYALHAVYGNKANPYTKLDREAEKRFQKVINACKVNKDNEEVISAVYENCEKHVQPSELIVRPAQLIAMYIHQPEKLKEVVEYFPELFEYFENVICAMDEALKDIDGKVAWKSSYVYSRLTDNNKVKVQNSLMNFKNVKVKLSELVPENSSFFESLTSEQIVKLLKNGFLDFDDPHFRDIEELIDVRWGNLGDALRNEILCSNLKFDGEIVEFGRIYELYPDAFECLASDQLFHVLKGGELAIGVSNGCKKGSEGANEFYIDRKLIPEDVKLIYFDYEGQVDHQISHEDSHKCANIVKSPDSTRRQFNDPAKTSDDLNADPNAKSAVHQPDGSLGLQSSNLCNPGTFQEYYTNFIKQNFEEYHKKLTKIRQNSNFNSQDYNLNQKNFHDLYKNSSEIIEHAEKDRILILSGETGAGKTATLRQILNEVRKMSEFKWVLYIDVVNLMDFVGRSSEGQRFVNFFGKLGGKFEGNERNMKDFGGNFGKNEENLEKYDKNPGNSHKIDENLNKFGEKLGKVDEKLEKVEENLEKIDKNLENSEKIDKNFGKFEEKFRKNELNAKNLGINEQNLGSLIKNLRKTNENSRKMGKTLENSVKNLRKMGKNSENSGNSEKLDSNLEKSGQNLGKTDEKMEKVDENSKNSVESLRKTVKNSQNLGKIEENSEKIAIISENSIKKMRNFTENSGKIDQKLRKIDENSTKTPENSENLIKLIQIKPQKSRDDLKNFNFNLNSEDFNIQNLCIDIFAKIILNYLNLPTKPSKFEVNLFQESLKSGNVVLFWDNFDQIPQNYIKNYLNLFKFIHTNTSNVQYIGTSPSNSDELGKYLKIRPWQLVPFGKAGKAEFLKKYFMSQAEMSPSLGLCADNPCLSTSNPCLPTSESAKIDNNVVKVQRLMKQFNSNDSFVYDFDTPLMLQFLSMTDDSSNIFKFTQIYKLFDNFIQNKVNIWLENFPDSEKSEISTSIRIIFQKFSLLSEFSIFSSTTLGLKLKKLQIFQTKIPENLTVEKISKLKILIFNGQKKFKFFHKTFSEFFFAQYFLDNILNVNGYVDINEAELRLELFYHLMQNYGNLQHVHTDFMSSYLHVSHRTKKKFNPTISILLRTKFKSFFIRMLDTNHPKIFEFLFDFFMSDHGLLIDLLHVYEDETLYTACFNPNYFGLFVDPEEIRKFGRNHLTDEEFESFVNGKHQKGTIMLGVTVYELLGISKSYDNCDSKFEDTSLVQWQHKGLVHLGEASGAARAGQQVPGAVKGSQQQAGVSQAGQQQLGTSQAAQQQPGVLKAIQEHPGVFQAGQQQSGASQDVQQQPGATTAAQSFPGASQATPQHPEASQAVLRKLGASQAVKEQPRPLLATQHPPEPLDIDPQPQLSTTYWKFLQKSLKPQNFIQKLFTNPQDDHLTENDQKQLFMTAINPKIYLFYDKLFSTADFIEYKKLWTNFENLLSKSDMQEAIGIAMISYFEICPDNKDGHDLFLYLLLKKAKKLLTNSQIYEIFMSKNILHESFWDSGNFKILWSFLADRTTKDERKQLLMLDDLGDKNFYFFSLLNESKDQFSSHKFVYYFYDFTALKLIHRTMTTGNAPAFKCVTELYEKFLTKTEFQELILTSNDFMLYLIGKSNEKSCEKFGNYLEKLFNGSEDLLLEFLDRKVQPTNLTIFEFVDDLKELAGSKSKWFVNLGILKDLYGKIKNNKL